MKCEVVRRIDLWTMQCSPSKGFPAISYEIKASRSDFLQDVKVADKKHRGALMYSNKFYYVAPVGLIQASELPVWAGLIEIITNTDGTFRTRVVVKAYPRSKAAPSWSFVVSLLRRVPVEPREESPDA